jgi:mercuric ion transport protein
MNNKSNSGKLAGASVLSAIAASLCCITPVLALISGASGAASAFSWITPARPYLLGVTVLVLGFAWYQKLKPRTAEEIQCACEEDEKPPFMQSKKFLGIVTIFAALMMAFPYYAKIFYPKPQETKIIMVDKENIVQEKFIIADMDCEACVANIDNQISKVPGVIEYHTSYANGNSIVKFDKTKTSAEDIATAINKTEFKVTRHELIK